MAWIAWVLVGWLLLSLSTISGAGERALLIALVLCVLFLAKPRMRDARRRSRDRWE